MGLFIDRSVNNIENLLTNVSALPVIGTIAGCTKFVCGTAQLITALAFSILSLVPVATVGDWDPLKYSLTHIKHGVGNMIAGVVESIPIVQTVVWGSRQLSGIADEKAVQLCIDTGHKTKFMPYSSLIEREWRFSGVDMGNIQQRFNDRVKQYEDKATEDYKKQNPTKKLSLDFRVYMSPSERLAMARDLVKPSRTR